MLPLVVTISVLVFLDIATPSHSWKCLFPPSRVKFQGSQSVLSVQRRRELLLDGPTLEIEAGSMTVLTGPSGAGKTIWMKEMMACLNGSEQMGDGISCAEGSGAEKLRGVWCDRYTVSRSKQAPSVSLSIIESVESKLTPPCVLFVDELVDTESMPVRRAVYKGVNDLCREKMCAAVWATHKFEGLSGRRVGLRNGRLVSTTELHAHLGGEGGGGGEEVVESVVEPKVEPEVGPEVDEQPPPSSPAPTPNSSSISPLVSDVLIKTNEFFRTATISPVRNFLTIPSNPPPSSPLAPLEAALSPPTLPPIPRPTWLTISMSVPTGLLWYGYYKFSVEEELFQMELRQTGRVSGAGGYGTLIGFSYAVIFGGFFSLLPLTEGFSELILRTAGVLLLASQVNLYCRVNELCEEVGIDRPLHPWWALLPPPLDVVVGLRQVHYLALYATKIREEEWQRDKVAEEWFPFISSERFTLKEFVREPRRWFRLPFLNTEEWEDFW